MADFKSAVANTFKAEGGYQADPDDNANYINGHLIGTNRGISACAYYAYYKRIPTIEDMVNLSVDQAMQIFKGNYWDKVAGDFIVNQSVAELMFQFVIGSGASQISDIKAIANKTHQVPVLVENDLPITKSDANYINGLNQPVFHSNMWKWRMAFYDQVVSKNPAKAKFLKGWQNRLNTHKFRP